MTCRYCNIALAPSRSFVDGEFCCDDHRQRFESQETSEREGSDASKITERISSALASLRRRFSPSATATSVLADDNQLVNSPESLESEVELAQTAEISDEESEFTSVPEAEAESEPVVEAAAFAATEVEAGEVEAADVAVADLEGAEAEAPERIDESVEAAADPAADSETVTDPPPHPMHEAAGSWRWLHATWRGAPRDLKLISVLLPILLVIAITGSLPKVPIEQLAPQNFSQVQGEVQKVVADHWKNFNQTISDRAAVAYTDDFRSGLDAWESRSNLTRSWSYDASGFVRPGPLAVFKPTVDLSDYRFEFLGEIDQKAMGWAFRAADLNNYYAMKFVIEKPGPLPLVHIVRYAVIGGKEGPHIDKPLPLTVRADMLYRIQVDARGGDFTILAQGQVVDFWSDNRLSHGGVGFFCNRGERARLRWVEVSHQYDALGRLCAYLAPYGIEGRNGNIN